MAAGTSKLHAVRMQRGRAAADRQGAKQAEDSKEDCRQHSAAALAMTSMCSQSAPSSTMRAHSSARRAKSALRIEGLILVGGRSRRAAAGAAASASAAAASASAAAAAAGGAAARVAMLLLLLPASSLTRKAALLLNQSSESLSRASACTNAAAQDEAQPQQPRFECAN